MHIPRKWEWSKLVWDKKPKSIKKDVINEFKNPIRIEGLTTMEVSRRLGLPKETARVHLERYESDGILESIFVGKTKIYGIKKAKSKR